MGSELVRLAATGRIDIQDRRIHVLDQAATGDAELGSLVRPGKPAWPTQWVGRPRRGMTEAYLNRLVAGGTLRVERRRDPAPRRNRRPPLSPDVVGGR